MYVPDGVDLTREEKMEMAKQKQEIDYSNTRLNHMPFDESSNKNPAQVSKLVSIKTTNVRIEIGNQHVSTSFRRKMQPIELVSMVMC